MKELIELILSYHKDRPHGYWNTFEIRLVQTRRNRVTEETKMIYNIDDVVSFLFDCDTHLWELVSYNVSVPQYGYDHWYITLTRGQE